MATIISSQQYLDETIVAEKVAAGDFTVTLSPEFAFDGETYQIVLDGHHSLAAAQAAHALPVWHEATAGECDSLVLLTRGEIENFLEIHYLDSDWYDIETGISIW